MRHGVVLANDIRNIWERKAKQLRITDVFHFLHPRYDDLDAGCTRVCDWDRRGKFLADVGLYVSSVVLSKLLWYFCYVPHAHLHARIFHILWTNDMLEISPFHIHIFDNIKMENKSRRAFVGYFDVVRVDAYCRHSEKFYKFQLNWVKLIYPLIQLGKKNIFETSHEHLRLGTSLLFLPNCSNSVIQHLFWCFQGDDDDYDGFKVDSVDFFLLFFLPFRF